MLNSNFGPKIVSDSFQNFKKQDFTNQVKTDLIDETSVDYARLGKIEIDRI